VLPVAGLTGLARPDLPQVRSTPGQHKEETVTVTKTFEPASETNQPRNPYGYRFLTPRHIDMIDQALHKIGLYGEVRLVVEKGRLRFLVTLTSHDALSLQTDGAWDET
jgi:hypothetical protein